VRTIWNAGSRGSGVIGIRQLWNPDQGPGPWRSRASDHAPQDGFLFLDPTKFADSFASDVEPGLVATDDKMIPPDAQRSMAKRAGATIAEAKGSHEIYVSQPELVANLIAQAAEGEY
jgi:hypothetical protein